MIVDPNNAMSFTAFRGREGDAQGEGKSILFGDRFVEMAKRSSYYECTQHDHKTWDFDGRMINPRTMQPLMGAERAWFVPLKMRRPSTPVRLGKVIVDSFTNLVFGENRFPNIRVEGDDKTEDWIQTVSRVGKLPLKMIEARNMGGAAGTVGVSWCFFDGKPRYEVHRAQNLFVHRWKDRLQLIPEWVSEVYLFSKIKWDGRAYNKVWYWFRRDWTPDGDYVFKTPMVEKDKEPEWEIDWEKSIEHGDGDCHLEWIQNLPTDDQDGKPDYDGLYENFDQLDMLMSVIVKGATLNLDPTLKLKMDRDEIDRLGIKKGSDNALITGKDGDAEYLELGGQSITAGLDLVKEKRRYILETAQCIVPDPSEVAAQGVSSVTIKALYASMTSKADVLREQYGSAMERILKNQEKSARTQMAVPVTVSETVERNVIDELTGDNVLDQLTGAPVMEQVVEDVPAIVVLDLPPKLVKEPIIDVITGGPAIGDDGKPMEKYTRVPRELGPEPGAEITMNWPPYFAPTPTDQTAIVTALSTATGGKPFISQETATEQAARAFGQDPAEEWRRVQAEATAQQSQQAAMFDAGAAGGEVVDPNAKLPGQDDPPPPPPPPPAGAPKTAEDVVGPHPKSGDDDVPADLDLRT